MSNLAPENVSLEDNKDLTTGLARHASWMIRGASLMAVGSTLTTVKVLEGTNPQEFQMTNAHNYGIVGIWLGLVGLLNFTTGVEMYADTRINSHFERIKMLNERKKAALARPTLAELHPDLMNTVETHL